MGTMPVLKNELADFFDGVIQAGMGGGEKGVEAYIAVQAPVLEGPFLGIITNAVVEAVGSAVAKNMEKMSTALVIDFQVNGETSKAYQAIQALKDAKAKGNADAIKQASDDYDKAMAALVHWDGTATI